MRMIKECKVCNKNTEHAAWNATTCIECTKAGYKWCSECNSIKLLSDFHRNGTKIRSKCRKCEIARTSVLQKENKVRVNQLNKQRQQVKYATSKDFKQSRDTSTYKWRSNNREAYNQAISRYKRERYRTDEAYRLTCLNYSHNRRTNIEGTLTDQDWQECLEYFDTKCAYCGSTEQLTMDHVDPVSKGGTHTVTNIVCACKSCNSSKGTKNIIKWYGAQPFFSQERLNRIFEWRTMMRQVGEE